MKTNVLYIIEEFVLGGAERVLIDQALSLSKVRFNVFVCCLRQKGEFAFHLENAGIEIAVLGKKRGVDISIIPKVMRVIKEKKIHIVHTHLWVANFWGRLAAILSRVPVVITEHNVDAWKPWYYKLMDRCLWPFTKKICVVSEEVKKFYHTEISIPLKKLEVVYNGINLNEKPCNDDVIDLLRGELGIKGTIPIIANIGRLVEDKAHHIFIEACSILRERGLDYHALIIGDGPLKDNLVNQTLSLGLVEQVTFTGLRKDIPAILSIIDICVLSSTREGLPIIILEAMAKGVPFVATDVGGNREVIVEGETGLLAPSGNPAALADVMANIITNPDLAEHMCKASINRVEEKFSLKRMVDQTEKIYLAV